MKNTDIRFPTWALSLILIWPTSCSDREDDNSPGMAEKSQKGDSEPNRIANSTPEHAEEVPIEVRDQLPDALTEQFHRLRQPGPKLPVYVSIANEMWTKDLDANSMVSHPLEALMLKPTEENLIENLRNGGTISGIERKTAIGYMSLITGWLMDDENKMDIHFLFSKRASSDEVSNGDLMLALLTKESLKFSSGSGELTGSQLEEWSRLAKGKNPAVRQISAFLLPQLTSNQADIQAFALQFSDESEISVIETLVEGIQKLPLSQRDDILSDLAGHQHSAGNLEISEYINSNISSPD